MPNSQIHGVKMRGVVCAVPGEPVRIEDLGLRFGLEEIERVKKTVGLKQLHRVERQTAGDLCGAAAEELLRRLSWAPDSIDALICVTQQPDHFLPATACILHQRLGLSSKAAAFDIALGCSGYTYGLLIAGQFVASGYKRVLLLAGDTVSRVCSPRDKSTAFLFGDAGSATALEQQVEAPTFSFVTGSDGSGAASLSIPDGGFRTPITEASRRVECDESGNCRSSGDLFMDGLAVFAFSLQRVPPLVTAILALHGWSKGECDRFLFHQANGFMLSTLAKKMGLPAERVPVNIDRYGNTSSASIPLLLADDLADLLTTGTLKLALAGFGVGFSWAAMAGEIGQLEAAAVIQVAKDKCFSLSRSNGA